MNRLCFIIAVFGVLCLTSCHELKGEHCFIFQTEFVDDIKACQTLTPNFVCHALEGQLSLNIYDSLYISFNRNKDNLCSIYNINDNFKLIDEFCPQGRAFEEIISLGGVNDIWLCDNSLLMPLYALAESKLLILDLNESIAQHRTIYSTVTRLSPAGRKPIYNCYMLGHDHILAYNSNQNPVVNEMLEPPVFEVYDIHTGDLIRTIDVFNKIDGYNDPYYNGQSFVSNFTCIKPDRTRMVFAMYYHPQFNILNIETGETMGFALKGRKAFSTKHPTGHFISVCADDESIYALYLEKTMHDSVLPPVSLYIIDWQGQIKAHFNLAQFYNLIGVDGDKLYFASRMTDELYICSIESIKKGESLFLSED